MQNLLKKEPEKVNYNSAILNLTGWKNCEFDLYGVKITLEKNEIVIKLKLKTKLIKFRKASYYNCWIFSGLKI